MDDDEVLNPIAEAVDDGALTITLNRPESLNAIGPELAQAAKEAVQRGAEDPAIRAIVLTGAGRAFSAGVDLKAPKRQHPDGSRDLGSNLREFYNPLVLAIGDAPKPVVAAVHGAAAGLGAALAFACDLIVAAESAYFLLAFRNIALVPDGGTTFNLPLKIGRNRAMDLALRGHRLPARGAQEWGLVSEIYPDDAFAAQAKRFVADLAHGPTKALADTKRAFRAGERAALAAHMELEADLQACQSTTEDFVEGGRAFAERRPPAFTGQ